MDQGLVNNATKHSPSPTNSKSTVTTRKSLCFGSPIGLAANSIWVLYCHKKLHETENPLISSNSFSAFKGQKPKHHHEWWRHNNRSAGWKNTPLSKMLSRSIIIRILALRCHFRHGDSICSLMVCFSKTRRP